MYTHTGVKSAGFNTSKKVFIQPAFSRTFPDKTTNDIRFFDIWYVLAFFVCRVFFFYAEDVAPWYFAQVYSTIVSSTSLKRWSNDPKVIMWAENPHRDWIVLFCHLGPCPKKFKPQKNWFISWRKNTDLASTVSGCWKLTNTVCRKWTNEQRP